MEYYISLLETYNPNGVLFSFVIWITLLMISKPNITLVSPIRNNTIKGFNLGFILFFVVCIFGLHRWDTYHIDDTLYGVYDHLEPIHKWLLVTLSLGHIFLYRIIVYGLASYILFYIAKKIDLNNRNFLLVCTLFLVDSMFCEMRGTIGHTFLLLGYVMIIHKSFGKLRIKNVVMGCFFIFLSFFLHRSIFICIFFAILSLFDFAKKSVIIASWIVFPLLVVLFDRYFSSLLNIMIVFDYGDMGIGESLEIYGEGDFTFGQYNLVGNIVRIITNLSNYLVFFYLTIQICFRKIKIENIYKYLFRWYYICFYVGILLSCTEINDWLSHRVLVMALYPMPFVLSRIWKQESLVSKWTKAIIISGIIGGILSYAIRYRDWLSLV